MKPVLRGGKSGENALLAITGNEQTRLLIANKVYAKSCAKGLPPTAAPSNYQVLNRC